MSDVATAELDANAAPSAGAGVQGQFGPNILGSGRITFNVTGHGFRLFFAREGESVAAYGLNGQAPATPLQPDVWTPIQGATSVIVRYAVPVRSDLKLLWAQ